MKSCTFFGHREIWRNIDNSLTDILVDLIEKEGVCRPLGGALKAKEYAQRKGKRIINIAE